MDSVIWMLIETAGSLLASACVLRAYAWRVHLNPNNPLAQFMRAMTDWFVGPLSKVIKPTRKVDWPSVVGAAFFALLTAAIFFVMTGGTFDPIRLVLLAVVWLIRWSCHLAMGIIVIMALISMINPYAPLAPAFNQLADPLLKPFRKAIPLMGSFDLSPLVVLLLIQVILMFVQPGNLFGLRF